jgi:hypothetical protein
VPPSVAPGLDSSPLPDPRLIGLLERVDKACASIGDKEGIERPQHSLRFMALFDRCRSMLGAVHLLVVRGFAHEALMLCRPLLTDSLALAEIAMADEQGRAKLAVRWELAGLASIEGAVEEGARQGHDMAEQADAIRRRREQSDAYAKRNGFQRPRQWQPDNHAKALAQKHGRGDEYLDMLILHHFVHGSTFATAQRYSRAGDTIFVGGTAAETEEWGKAAALSAAQSALHAARSTCQILSRPEPRAIGALLAELETWAEDVRKTCRSG